MAMTKVEAAKLTQDMLLRGVTETIVKESRLLQLLPFTEVTGTAVTYNRELTMPAVAFYDVGDVWAEATPTFTQVTTALKILGGDADVDNFLQATYADPNDIEAEVKAWTPRQTPPPSAARNAASSVLCAAVGSATPLRSART